VIPSETSIEGSVNLAAPSELPNPVPFYELAKLTEVSENGVCYQNSSVYRRANL